MPLSPCVFLPLFSCFTLLAQHPEVRLLQFLSAGLYDKTQRQTKVGRKHASHQQWVDRLSSEET